MKKTIFIALVLFLNNCTSKEPKPPDYTAFGALPSGNTVVTFQNGHQCVFSDLKLEYTIDKNEKGGGVTGDLLETYDVIRNYDQVLKKLIFKNSSQGEMHLEFSQIDKITFGYSNKGDFHQPARVDKILIFLKDGREINVKPHKNQLLIPDSKFSWQLKGQMGVIDDPPKKIYLIMDPPDCSMDLFRYRILFSHPEFSHPNVPWEIKFF